MRIELDFWELEMAAMVGVQRNLHAITKGYQHKYGASDNQSWNLHIEGAIGEFVVAKALNVFWPGKGCFKQIRDVGNVEVRTTSYSSGNLILHKEDPDDVMFYLVTGVNGIYDVRGKITGYEGKQEKFWTEKNNNGRPAYFVPQEFLKGINE